MTDLVALLSPLPYMLVLATVAWFISLARHDTGVVDSFWSLFFATALFTWHSSIESSGSRPILVLLLVIAWALRLSIHLTIRNWGKPEDRRYQAIRKRNQPHYPIKSLFYVFYLQVGLAWVVLLPILPALQSLNPLGPLDFLGITIFVTGFAVESIADWQLARFKRERTGHEQVMDRGLWRYSRHPNYFGEALLWWGFALISFSSGAPLWMIVSPAFMTFLLLKVSGVPLLEADLKDRNPEYKRYIEKTSAFWPRLPR